MLQRQLAGVVGAVVLAWAGPAMAQRFLADDPAAMFTAEQAARGKTAYGRYCVACHGASLEGTQFGPTLKGEAFESHWRGRSRADFSLHLRTSMPPGGMGAVSGRAYTDIEAYLLQGNGHVASTAAVVAQATSKATAPVAAAAAAETPESRVVGASPRQVRLRGDDGPLYQQAMKAREARLAALTPVTDAMLRQPPAADWLVWRRGYEGLGHSPLAQIHKGNVAQLRTAWSWSLPESMNEITPLVHDGVMFIYSGPVVQALDAVTGELLWQHLRVLPDELDNGRAARVKTLAIHGEQLFAPTTDGHLLALDMRTGKVLWDHEVIPDAQRTTEGKAEGVALHLNGGPIVVKGKVIFGVSLGLEKAPGGCFIVALDVATGKEIWRFHTIARPGQPGGDSWNGAPVNERFGGGVWTAGSYDAELDLVYFGIGNTYNSATLLEPRPGTKGVTNNDGLYTDATVALRPDTGELAWHYQHHRRDVWDLDWVFEQTVVTLPVDGVPRKLVVTGGKTAIFEAVDAATGAFVFAKDLGVQNLVTWIDPRTGEKSVNPAVQPEAGKAKLLCPAASGARNWPATALDPQAGLLFVPIIETCTEYTYAPRTAAETAAGGADMRFAPRLPPGTDGRFGRLLALDLKTREVKWSHRQRMPIAGAALATAGGLVFNGDLDRYFTAYDQENGAVLWRTRLNAAPESFPITFLANGKQYVAVVAGGGSAFGANGRGLVPELVSPAAAVTLHVFELPAGSAPSVQR
jgi:alcohol dehydrogenase (cytochrome c)